MSGARQWASFREILKRTHDVSVGFVLSGGSARYRCIHCDMSWEQTSGNWRAMREHRFEEHGEAATFDWTILHGKKLEIGVVVTENEPIFKGTGDEDRLEYDIYGRAEDGTVYHLHSAGLFDGSGWKWRNAPAPEKTLPEPTLSAAASPSNG